MLGICWSQRRDGNEQKQQSNRRDEKVGFFISFVLLVSILQISEHQKASPTLAHT
jgi:hypothetical protein